MNTVNMEQMNEDFVTSNSLRASSRSSLSTAHITLAYIGRISDFFEVPLHCGHVYLVDNHFSMQSCPNRCPHFSETSL